MTYVRALLPIGVIIALFSLALLWQNASNSADRLGREVKVANAKIADQAAALKQRDIRIADLEREAVEKLADDTALDTAKEELTDAIQNIPAGTAPSPTAVAAGCIRLRQAGATSGDAFKRICGARR